MNFKARTERSEKAARSHLPPKMTRDLHHHDAVRFTLQKLHYCSSPFQLSHQYGVKLVVTDLSDSGHMERVSNATWAFSRSFSPHLKSSTEPFSLETISFTNQQTILKTLDRSPLSTSRLLDGCERKPDVQRWKGFCVTQKTWISLIIERLDCAWIEAA